MMLGRQVVRAHSAARIDSLNGVLRRGAFEAECEALLALARRAGPACHPRVPGHRPLQAHQRPGWPRGGRPGAAPARPAAAGHPAQHRPLQTLGRRGIRVLLPGQDRVRADATLQRLTQTLARATIPVPDGCAALTVGIGYAVWTPGSAMDPRQPMAQADAAMYEAKRRGRNTPVDPGAMPTGSESVTPG